MFRSEGKQPRLADVFRGAGIWVSEDEKQECHPEIDVFFQSNAWFYQQVCMEWCKQTLLPSIEEEGFS